MHLHIQELDVRTSEEQHLVGELCGLMEAHLVSLLSQIAHTVTTLHDATQQPAAATHSPEAATDTATNAADGAIEAELNKTPAEILSRIAEAIDTCHIVAAQNLSEAPATRHSAVATHSPEVATDAATNECSEALIVVPSTPSLQTRAGIVKERETEREKSERKEREREKQEHEEQQRERERYGDELALEIGVTVTNLVEGTAQHQIRLIISARVRVCVVNLATGVKMSNVIVAIQQVRACVARQEGSER